jgi:hypothetical protein
MTGASGLLLFISVIVIFGRLLSLRCESAVLKNLFCSDSTQGVQVDVAYESSGA